MRFLCFHIHDVSRWISAECKDTVDDPRAHAYQTWCEDGNEGDSPMTGQKLLRIEKKHLVAKSDGYLHYESDVRFEGDVLVESDLGWIKFACGIRATGSIIIEAGTEIEAGEGIKAGTGIKAGEGIKAGTGIKAGEGIKVFDR
jgi:hypothetical protein